MIKINCSCGFTYIGFEKRHVMFNCPRCGQSGVDIENDYTRLIGNVNSTEEFQPPHFTDEEEYHSSLLTWLNDSDEEYSLFKDDGILYIHKNQTEDKE
jgi:predicted RNA-binding Zn-ribbon protein involved in translation (DUF1610 family)